MDPDGNNPIIATIFSAVGSGLQNGFDYKGRGMNFWDGFWRGAIPGAVAGFAGYYAPTGFTDGIFYGIGVGGATGALSAELNGGDIGEGILNGGVNGGIYAGITSYFKGLEAIKYQRAPDNLTACANCGPGDLDEVIIKGKKTPSHYKSQIGIPFAPPLPAIPISAVRTYHGNDNRNPNLHYVYQIIFFDRITVATINAEAYDTHKFGIAEVDNSFKRASIQVRRLNRHNTIPNREYDFIIKNQNIVGRFQAKIVEQYYVTQYTISHKGFRPVGNKLPLPWGF